MTIEREDLKEYVAALEATTEEAKQLLDAAQQRYDDSLADTDAAKRFLAVIERGEVTVPADHRAHHCRRGLQGR